MDVGEFKKSLDFSMKVEDSGDGIWNLGLKVGVFIWLISNRIIQNRINQIIILL